MTMLNTKQNIKREVNKLLGNRGLRIFFSAPTSTSGSQDVPGESDSPSFTANKTRGTGMLAPPTPAVRRGKGEPGGVGYLQEWWHRQKSTLSFWLSLRVAPGRTSSEGLRLRRRPLQVHCSGISLDLLLRAQPPERQQKQTTSSQQVLELFLKQTRTAFTLLKWLKTEQISKHRSTTSFKIANCSLFQPEPFCLSNGFIFKANECSCTSWSFDHWHQSDFQGIHTECWFKSGNEQFVFLKCSCFWC